MLIPNTLPSHGEPLDIRDADLLSVAAAASVEGALAHWPEYGPTPLVGLPVLARELGVRAIHVKDEGLRAGLGSFKALGGAYAVACLALGHAGRRLGRDLAFSALIEPDVRTASADLTFGCATDGNHGRSVAWGARHVGAASAIFVHAGVSEARSAAIAGFGAEVIRVPGTYDDSVEEAARVCATNGWTVVSDTSWPGYEDIPGLVMQGYTALLREALRQLPAPPTHVFIQAGVGGIAATLAGHLAIVFGDNRPKLIVVEPSRAACLFASAQAGRSIKIAHGEPTVMAMLECYEPSLVAWRILSRAADAFMTVEEADAVAAMNRLARPSGADPAIVAGESGGVGLAGLSRLADDVGWRERIGLGPDARVLLVNTEGATDPQRYRALTGLDPHAISQSG